MRPTIVVLVLSACTGQPAQTGMFNNERDFGAAVRTQDRAWLDTVGRYTKVRRVTAIMARHGGGCSAGLTGAFTCSVDVRPTWPSVFTRRIHWTVRFDRQSGDMLRYLGSHPTYLGLDA